MPCNLTVNTQAAVLPPARCLCAGFSRRDPFDPLGDTALSLPHFAEEETKPQGKLSPVVKVTQ